MSDATTPAHPAFDCIVALGSNLGDKAANIDRAIALLDRARRRAAARPLAQLCDGAVGQDGSGLVRQRRHRRRNASSTRGELLGRCKEIERAMGRVETEKWGPRIIDLDLLVYRDREVNEPDLVLPHPHIGARAFVLAPLMDIAPDLDDQRQKRARDVRRDRRFERAARWTESQMKTPRIGATRGV